MVKLNPALKDFRGEVESRVKDITGDFDSRLDDVRDQAGNVRKQANDNWDKLENIFEDRVSRVLKRLGLPTSDDVDSLSKRVQDTFQESCHYLIKSSR